MRRESIDQMKLHLFNMGPHQNTPNQLQIRPSREPVVKKTRGKKRGKKSDS
jgi:hypothetical protein